MYSITAYPVPWPNKSEVLHSAKSWERAGFCVLVVVVFDEVCWFDGHATSVVITPLGALNETA